MIEDKNTALEVWTEHAFLKEMEAGCHAPLAAEALIEAESLTLTAAVGKIDGSRIIKRKVSTKKLNLNSLKKLGEGLAQKMKADGAAEILARLKK